MRPTKEGIKVINLKAIALGAAVTLTAATAVFALNNRITHDDGDAQICVLSTTAFVQSIGTCSAAKNL